MRTATAPELAILAANMRSETLRVKVANGSGTMKDVSSWVESYSVDNDQDQPVGGATVSFTRANGPTQSFSPLRTDSTINLKDDLVTYAPQLDINRAITIELATTAIGTAPVAGDYKLLFQGTIDIVDFSGTPVTVTCRDQGATLVDRWIEVAAPFGSLGGVAVETVMQQVIDSVFGGGVITLFNNTSPPVSYVISPAYQQQIMSVMDAEVALAQLPGDDVRYKWDDGTSTFRFTLSTPPRTKTTPDYTFGPSAYFDVTQLSLDITNIRNVIIVNYPDSADFGNRHVLTVSDSASITKYGRRTLFITEGSTSPINTSGEATTLANAALADLKDPKADQELELPLFWPGDLGDLYRFSANNVHYNTNQDLAVVQITHVGQKTSAGFRNRTHIKVRGSPIGQYNTWLTRGGTIGGPAGGGQAKAPVAFIIPRGTEINDLTWDLQFYATYGTGGGGTNLTYTITLKKSFGAATTLDTGNATAFPRNLTVTRDVRYAAVLTFTVADAATGISAQQTYAIPAVTSNIINGSGQLLADTILAGATQRAATFAELPSGTQTKTMIVSSAAFIPTSNSTTVYTSFTNGLSPVSGTPQFIAFAPLPQGVTITKLQMWSKNPTAGGSTSITLQLLRQDAVGGGGATGIVTVTRTAVAADTGGLDSSSTVSELVSTNTYCLFLNMGDSADLFQNAIITYTMPSYDKTV